MKLTSRQQATRQSLQSHLPTLSTAVSHTTIWASTESSLQRPLSLTALRPFTWIVFTREQSLTASVLRICSSKLSFRPLLSQLPKCRQLITGRPSQTATASALITLSCRRLMLHFTVRLQAGSSSMISPAHSGMMHLHPKQKLKALSELSVSQLPTQSKHMTRSLMMY